MSENFTLKEMVMELRQESKTAMKTDERVLTTLQNIEDHLKTLNGKVAANVKEINNLKSFKTQITTYATIFAAGVSIVINKFL